MSVFVRWYGSILQGEVVENQEKGILGGMVAVRIQVQGAIATALFAPEHVYDSLQKTCGDYPKYIMRPAERIHKRTDNPIIPHRDLNVLKFKEEHWDHEHNHLRIDALDEFYRLWRDNMAMRLGTNKPQPAMKVETPSTPDEALVTLPSHKPQPIVSDKRMAELKKQLKKSLKPVTVKQLSLFD